MPPPPAGLPTAPPQAGPPLGSVDTLPRRPSRSRPLPEAPTAPALDVPEPTAGRMQRLRARLARSQNVLGRGLLAVLARDRLDDEAWEEIEDALLGADVGVRPTTEIVERLRTRTQVLGTRDPAELRALLAEELVTALQPELDRTLHTISTGDGPAVVLVVGRERHRQDHHLRQAGPGAGGRRPQRAAGRRRHLPGGGRRPAADLGLPGGCRDRPRPRGRRPGQRGLRGRPGRQAGRGRHRR